MEGIAKLYSQSLQKGNVKISKFSVSEEDAKLHNLRCATNNYSYVDFIHPGNYVKLNIGGELYMTDTPMEQKTNQEFVYRANGRVMVAGLGLGLVLHNLRKSVEEGKVKSIVIYEKFQDVIDLVMPLFQDMPIVCKCEDILEYVPPREEKYDTIYFDIWPSVSPDNLPDMKKLSNRWKFHLNRQNTDCWMNSWRKETCQMLNRR